MSATYPTATLGGGPDFRRNVTTYPGWSGDRTARYVGRCVLCGVRTFDDTDSNDPRGPMGDHAACSMVPEDYNATGDTVPVCFTCQNDSEERYTRALRRAERVGRWQYLEPGPGRPESCYTCGAPVVLADAPGNQYAGWIHTGPATFRRPSSEEERAHKAGGPRPSFEPVPYDGHAAYPRRSARVECRARVHHHSGSWCATCGGWG